ncbi:MAG TPA: hypothetical protein VGA37_09835 [Gemmatimonadales bacterium]
MFDNTGTYRKVATGTNVQSVQLTNRASGTIDIQAGSLELTAGTDTLAGALQLGAGAQLAVTGGGVGVVLAGGVAPTGPGLLRQTSGTLTIGQAATDTVTLPRYEFAGGTLNGPGVLLLADSLRWTSGTMAGTGVTHLVDTATAELSGTAGKVLTSRLFENAGTVLLSGIGDLFIGGTPAGVFDNLATGAFELQTAGGDVVFSGGVALFDNAGTYRKTATGTNVQSVQLANRASGTLDIQAGILELTAATDTLAGAVQLGAGAQLAVTGGAVVVLADGVAPTGPGLLRQTSGTLTIGQAATDTVTLPRYEFVLGTLNGPGVLLLVDSLRWFGGTMSGAGVTVVAGGTVAELIGMGGKGLLSRRFENAGTMSMSGSGNLSIGGTPAGVFDNQLGGSFDMQAPLGEIVFAGGGASFTNAGTYVKSAAGINQIQADFSNTGILDVAVDTLRFTAGFTHASTAVLQGGGTLDVSGASGVTLDGAINPGTSPGVLSITGAAPLSATTVVTIELGGTTAGTGYDQLDISAAATLGGTLVVDTVSPFVPAPGDRFAILLFNSRTADFASVTLPSLPGLLVDTATVVTGGEDTLFVTIASLGPPGTDVIWFGATDGDWDNPTNWSTGVVPTSGDDVFIVAGTPNAPTTSGNAFTNFLVLDTGASVSVTAGDTIFVASDLDAGYTSIDGGGVVSLTGAAGNVSGAVPSLRVTGGAYTMTDSLLTSGDVVITGTGAALAVNGHVLDIQGNLVVGPPVTGATGQLIMTNAADSVVVRGDATFQGDATGATMTAGALDIKGHFAQVTRGAVDNNFTPAGGHTTIFSDSTDAAPAQTIAFDGPGTSFFNHVRVVNASGNGVSLSTTVAALGSFTTDATAPVSGTALILTGDATFDGDVTLTALTLGGALSSANTYAVTTTTFVGAGQTIPAGLDYANIVVAGTGATLEGPTTATAAVTVSGGLTVGPDTLSVGTSFQTAGAGTVTMDDPAALIDVTGLVIFSGGSTDGLLTDGTLRIGDDFTQINTTSGASFAASGTHVTRFVNAGAGANAIAFTTPGATADSSHFANVEFANDTALATNTSLNSQVNVLGNLTAIGGAQVAGLGNTFVTGDVTVTGGATALEPTAAVWIGGTLTSTGTFSPATTVFNGTGQSIPSGTAYGYQAIAIRGTASFAAADTIPGSLTVGAGGNLDINGVLVQAATFLTQLTGVLTMDAATDSLVVTGNATFDGGSTDGLLSAGTLLVGGDLSQTSTNSASSFRASGTHLTVLDGAAPQTVTFDAPSAGESRFQDLDVTNTSSVAFASTGHVEGAMDVSSSIAVSGSDSLRVMGAGGLTTAVGGSLTVPVLETRGALAIGGTLTVDTAVFSGAAQTIPDIPWVHVFVENTGIPAHASGADSLNISGDLVVRGAGTDFNAGLLRHAVGGNLVIGPSGGGEGSIIMTTAPSGIDVGGNATFQGSSTGSNLSNGTFRVSGNITQLNVGPVDDNFRPTGTNTVVLNGVGPGGQTVSFAGSAGAASGFQFLQVVYNHPDALGVTFLTPAQVDGDLTTTNPGATVNGDTLRVLGDVSLAATPTLTHLTIGGALANTAGYSVGTTVFDGASQAIPSGPSFDYDSVTILGSASFDAAAEDTVTALVVGDGGNLDINTAFVQAATFATQGTGVLTMNDAADTLWVTGATTFDGGSTAGRLTAGRLILWGGFTQTNTNSDSSFYATGTHITEFANGTDVTLTFASAGALGSRFADLTVRAANARVSVNSDALVTGDLRIDDSNEEASTLDGAGTLTIDGDLTLFRSDFDAVISVDTVRLGGALSVSNGETVAPTTMEFFGTTLQSLPDPTVFSGQGFGPTNLLVTGDSVVLGGDLALAGSAEIAGTGLLDLNGVNLIVGGTFTTAGSGRLEMTTGGDSLDVTGAITFDGGSTDGKLTAGAIVARGDFSQGGTTSNTSFAPSGSLATRFSGTGAQAVVFATPDSSSSGSHFVTLELRNTSASGITLNSAVFVNGALVDTVGGATTLHGNGTVLTIRGTNIGGVTFDNLPVAIAEGAAWTAFDDITFTNMAATAIQLDVIRNGGSGGDIGLPSGIVFDATNINQGAGGRYLRADNANDTGTLVINVFNPTPLTASEGTDYDEVETGATEVTINWDA